MFWKIEAFIIQFFMISFYSGLFFLICHTFTRIFIKFFKAKLKIFNKLVKNENIKFPPKPIPCFTFINTFLLVFYVMTDWWWFLDSLIFWWLLSCSWLSDDCSAVPDSMMTAQLFLTLWWMLSCSLNPWIPAVPDDCGCHGNLPNTFILSR